MKRVYVCNDTIVGVFSAIYDAWKTNMNAEQLGIVFKGVIDQEFFCEYIEVTDTRKSDEVIVTDDETMIFFAHNVVNYLNYSFAKVETVPEEELFITIKYVEKDGTETVINANEDYVYWKDEYHKLMQNGVFATYVEGVFYDKTVVVKK